MSIQFHQRLSAIIDVIIMSWTGMTSHNYLVSIPGLMWLYRESLPNKDSSRISSWFSPIRWIHGFTLGTCRGRVEALGVKYNLGTVSVAT